MKKRMPALGKHPLCCLIRFLDTRIREHDQFSTLVPCTLYLRASHRLALTLSSPSLRSHPHCRRTA